MPDVGAVGSVVDAEAQVRKLLQVGTPKGTRERAQEELCKPVALRPRAVGEGEPLWLLRALQLGWREQGQEADVVAGRAAPIEPWAEGATDPGDAPLL